MKYIIAFFIGCVIYLYFIKSPSDSSSKNNSATLANDAASSRKDSGPDKNTSSQRVVFQDGEYVYRSRVAKGEQACEENKEKCLSLEEYQRMCIEISSITKQMSAGINAGLYAGNIAFRKLLEAGNFDAAKGEWLGKESWRSDSGIIGACEVTLTVSGLYEGTSTRATLQVYAQNFIVINGKVILHSALSAGLTPAML